MGLLDGMGGGMQGNPFAQYQQMQANPFTRQIPGTEYLGGMGEAGFQTGGHKPTPESLIPSDFAGVPPGLPNLPEDLQGFGFGQTAPEMNVNSNLRQGLIQQLLQQLMQGGDMQGMGSGMPGQMPMGQMPPRMPGSGF